MDLSYLLVVVALGVIAPPETLPSSPVKSDKPAAKAPETPAAKPDAKKTEPAQAVNLRFQGVKDQVMRYKFREENTWERTMGGKQEVLEQVVEVDFKLRVLSAGETGWQVELTYERFKGKGAIDGKPVNYDSGDAAMKNAQNALQSAAAMLVGKVYTLEVDPTGKVTKANGPEGVIPKSAATEQFERYSSGERVARWSEVFFRAAGDAPAQAKSGERWTYKSPHVIEMLGAKLSSTDSCRLEKIMGTVAYVRVATSTSANNEQGAAASIAIDRDREEVLVRWDFAKGVLKSAIGDTDAAMTISGNGRSGRVAGTGRVRIDRIE